MSYIISNDFAFVIYFGRQHRVRYYYNNYNLLFAYIHIIIKQPSCCDLQWLQQFGMTE